MHIFITNKSKTNIGCTVTVAKIYKKGGLIGVCIDTPNAVATVMANIKGVTKVINCFGEEVTVSESRINQNSSNTLQFAGYVAV